MKIEQIKTDKLIPYGFNNKIHDETQINRIANSIKEFWFTQPIVVDKDNFVIIWHWRLEAAKKLWLEEVPVVKMDNLTEQQVKKLRILDNKLNESEWNMENLKIELEDIKDLNIWDIELSIDEVFPELIIDNEDKAEKDLSDEIWYELCILLKFQTEEEQQVMYETLKEMWGFKDIKII